MEKLLLYFFWLYCRTFKNERNRVDLYNQCNDQFKNMAELPVNCTWTLSDVDKQNSKVEAKGCFCQRWQTRVRKSRKKSGRFVLLRASNFNQREPFMAIWVNVLYKLRFLFVACFSPQTYMYACVHCFQLTLMSAKDLES